jgi:tight adherence protein B
MTLLLYLLVFLSVLFAVQGFSMLTRARQTGAPATIRSRLRQLAQDLDTSGEDEDSLVRKKEKRSFMDQLVGFVPRFRRIDVLIYRAGAPMTVKRFYLLSVGLAVFGWLTGSVVLADPVLGVAFTFAGVLPLSYLLGRKRKRMHAFEGQLPEALDLVTRALRAGHSLTFGLQMVGDEMGDPIGTEFAQVSDEIALGADPRVAISNLATRIDVPDMPFLVTAILVQRETGGNLAEILDKLAAVIRERFKMHGKVRALVAQTKMSANILVAMPFVMVGLLYLVNEKYIEPLWTTESGHALAITAGLMIFIGYILCRRLAVVRI